MAEVKLTNVKKIYPGGVEAVKGASLHIQDKEFMVLVGPSGCGKSTTLRMIAGLEEISEGEISIGESVVNDVPPKNRDIAMVFQNYALYPHMTVYKNMAFGLMLRKYPKSEIESRVRDAAKILSIEHLLDRKPKALSGGERQRVAVGRAIVRQPKVFLFDEPLSNLDAKLRVQMRAEISKLHHRLQATMIYVTHDQVEAMTMGDRIVVMLDGEIQQIATPMDLYHRPVNKFVAGFIGSPPMNFVEGSIVAENGDLRFRDASETLNLSVHADHRGAVESYAGKKVFFGMRPEHFLENAAQSPVDGTSFTTRIEVVEPMGSEINLYLAMGDGSWVARIAADANPTVSADHVLDADMAQAHYFDAQTEKAIVG
jgi:multiple sugar transport system ATP-binding protein